jgi:hypothetical protein
MKQNLEGQLLTVPNTAETNTTIDLKNEKR